MAETWPTNKDRLKGFSKQSLIKGNFPDTINFEPVEADKFIDYIVDESVLLQDAVRVVKMTRNEKNIRAIGLAGKQILHPAGSFSKASHGFTEVNHDKITLQAKKARGVVTVYDDDLEDNIEGAAFANHLMQMIAREVGNELEDAYLMGEAAGDNSDADQGIRTLWDGWRKWIHEKTHGTEGSAEVLDARDGNVFNNDDGHISEQANSAPYNWEHKYHKMGKTLPTKYIKLGGGLGQFRFYNNDQVTWDYIESLTARGTAQGDAAIMGQVRPQYNVTPIVNMPLYPTEIPVKHADDVTTESDAEAAADQKVISVADASSFSAGDKIAIYSGLLGSGDTEVHTIASTNDTNNDITVVDNLERTHASGADVVKVTEDGTEVILTHRNNFIVGIQREMRFETERDYANEATNFWFSMRSDTAVENVASVVMLENVKIK